MLDGKVESVTFQTENVGAGALVVVDDTVLDWIDISSLQCVLMAVMARIRVEKELTCRCAAYCEVQICIVDLPAINVPLWILRIHICPSYNMHRLQ